MMMTVRDGMSLIFYGPNFSPSWVWAKTDLCRQTIWISGRFLNFSKILNSSGCPWVIFSSSLSPQARVFACPIPTLMIAAAMLQQQQQLEKQFSLAAENPLGRFAAAPLRRERTNEGRSMEMFYLFSLKSNGWFGSILAKRLFQNVLFSNERVRENVGKVAL